MEKIELRIGRVSAARLEAGTGGGGKLTLGNSVPVPERDYNLLTNKPQINGNELIGNKTTRQLGIEITDPLTNLEIESIISGAAI